MKDWERRAKFAIKKEVLKEFDGWSNQDFIEYILQLRELIELQKAELTPGTTETGKTEPVKESQFNKEWSIPTQIVFILHLSGKPMLSSEIFATITRLDKSFKDFMNAETVLSNYLSRTVRSGRIKKIKLPGIRTLYFALPEWVKENGELREEFRSMIKLF